MTGVTSCAMNVDWPYRCGTILFIKLLILSSWEYGGIQVRIFVYSNSMKLFMRLNVVKSGRELYMEQQLLQQVKQGDQASFNQLVEMFTPHLYRVVRRLASDQGEAEGIVQEAWFRAWKAFDRCSLDQPFFPWLARIALNVARDAWRKKRPIDFADLGEKSVWMADEELSIEEQLDMEEALERLQAGVEVLREEYRWVIALRYDGGLSYQEIAEILDVPLNTVRTYLHRAKAFLRKWMEAEYVRLAG
jgi:RNA polymerase sigma-70 factor (ECF subfamily)